MLPQNQITGKEIRVFVADDQKPVIRGIHHFLSKFFTMVGVSESAEEAVEKSLELKPDVVLMDIQFQRRTSGLYATEQIHKEAEDILILTLTGLPYSELLDSMFAAGACGYWLKTASHTKLVDAIRAACEGEFLNDEPNALVDFSRCGRESDKGWDTLSPLQKEIAKLIGLERNPGEILEALNVNREVYNTSRKRILMKLRVRNNVGVALHLIRKGVINL